MARSAAGAAVAGRARLVRARVIPARAAVSRVLSSASAPALLVAATGVAACGFPQPADVPEDEPRLHVSPLGDDTADGVTAPVRTLKRALGLATVNPALRAVELAGGRYAAAAGESFPYAVPAGLTVQGPAGGGAILIGSGRDIGLMIDAATLQDLELEAFGVAIVDTGSVQLTRVRVRSSVMALRGEVGAVVVADDLAVTGVAGGCDTAIDLASSTRITLTRPVSQAYAVTVRAGDQSTVEVSRASVSGAVGCASTPGRAAFSLGSGALIVSDSTVDGGDMGIWVRGSPGATKTTVSATAIRDTVHAAMYVVGDLDLDGGVFSANTTNLFAWGGTINLRNAKFVRNGLELGNGVVTMRGCSITASPPNPGGLGVYVSSDHR